MSVEHAAWRARLGGQANQGAWWCAEITKSCSAPKQHQCLRLLAVCLHPRARSIPSCAGKFVFGMGTLQVVLTLAAVAWTGMALTGGALGGPGAIILGGGLALSTTAVGMQVGGQAVGGWHAPRQGHLLLQFALSPPALFTPSCTSA